MSTDDLLLADEVAEILRVSPSTLATWRTAASKVAGPKWIKIGAVRIVYRRSAVDHWLAEQERTDA
jgi:predicted DNA-binding transcriptional regulator AlpA